MKRTIPGKIKVIALDQNGNPLTDKQKEELAFKIWKVLLEAAYPGVIVTKKEAGDEEKAGKGNNKEDPWTTDNSQEDHSTGHESWLND